MRTIDLNTQLIDFTEDNRKYIILGSDKLKDSLYVKEHVVPKIHKHKKELIEGFWGTLGFADDRPIDWKGTLKFSNNGNNEFESLIEDEVNLIKQGIPDLKIDSSSIKERFISFEDVDVKLPELFTLEQIPKLRLDLMLSPDEGAIMFYQDYKDNDIEEDILYIQPKPTDNNNTNERDRLTYIFDILPKFHIEADKDFPTQYKLKKERRKERFIVKIITFKRTYSRLSDRKKLGSKEIIEQTQTEINKLIQKTPLPKDHRLLLYSREQNTFREAKMNDIDSTKKTLCLVHGTFSDTEGSFGDLYGEKGDFLYEIVSSNNPTLYEQVIAFDHPTLFYDAEGNINEFFNCLDRLRIESFNKAVDLIGTSQGGLLVQYLANLSQDRIEVGKVALVSSANGVGYLSAAKFVPKLLSVLRKALTKTGNIPGAIITALAQHSAEFLLKQPGLVLMTPGSKELNSIIQNEPYREGTSYYPIVSDYDRDIFKNRFALTKYFMRVLCGAADYAAKPFLGKYHDMVVGTREQFIVPQKYCVIPNCTPDKYRHFKINATHGTVFQKQKAVKDLKEFLSNPDFYKTLPSFEPSKFDAHCHIFGRDVLTPRIVFLLIQDLFHFREEKSKNVKLPPIKIIDDDSSSKKKNKSGSVFSNIVKYFILNKDSSDVLKDLSEEYNDLESDVYRYIPLMFDLEMTFRQKYINDNPDSRITENENDFINLLKGFIEDIDDLVSKFENGGNLVFQGTWDENNKSIKYLKQIKRIINTIGLLNPKLKEKARSGYQLQLNEIAFLKKRYGDNLFPFLAVDPRRENMAQIILENVGDGKPFHGIKLYAPNGYSPTDPNLFDDSQKFIEGISLYSYCIKNDIPIMAHCSNAGFSTFVEELEVWGDIHINGKIKENKEKTWIQFNRAIPSFSFNDAVKERADVLNHPILWNKVLNQHTNLRICLAHFGGASDVWRAQIAAIMEKFPYVYTDLSCMVKEDRLHKIRKEYFKKDSKIKNRIMYGSDFYLNMLNKITFEDYYTHFESVFSKKELKEMSIDVPQRFL